MSPYMKSRVEQAYGSAKGKIYCAVAVSPGFLATVSQGFLEKQEAVKSGLIITQFFATLDAGVHWLKLMAGQEKLLD